MEKEETKKCGFCDKECVKEVFTVSPIPPTSSIIYCEECLEWFYRQICEKVDKH